MTNVEAVIKTLRDADVPFALIGALALAAHGVARATVDVDFMTAERRVLADDFWKGVREHGASVKVRAGDFEDPLAGVVSIDGDDAVDVVVAKYKWQRDVIERAKSVEMNKWVVNVPSPADLILLKLYAGGYGDLQDIARLISARGDKLIAEVTSALQNLPPDMRARWEKLLRELRQS